MRVALDVSAVPPQPVGAGVYTVELARGLAAHSDVDLHLVVRRGDERWSDLAPGATVHRVVPDPRPARIVWEAAKGGPFAASIGADLWHGPHYTLPRSLPCPSVVTVHDLTFFDQPETHERVKVEFFRRAITRNSVRATRVVCVSQLTARRLEELVAGHAPVDVAYHGVDHVRFHPARGAADTTTDRERLAARGIDGSFIAFVGTIQPRKGLPNLVDAFARIRDDHPDLALVVAGGDGWGTDALRAAIREHGVATSVIRPGYVDDDVVAALYREAAVVAYPSIAEGFGLPALEALACGSPLVTTSGTAMDEFVADAAITVPPSDPTALAAALRRALDPDVAASLRTRGPAVAARFSWTDCVETHIRVYRAALNRPARTDAGAT